MGRRVSSYICECLYWILFFAAILVRIVVNAGINNRIVLKDPVRTAQ